jgi:hypothetical protein
MGSFDTYPRPPYPRHANVSFDVVLPMTTRTSFQKERFKVIVHNAIIDLVKPVHAPRVFVVDIIVAPVTPTKPKPGPRPKPIATKPGPRPKPIATKPKPPAVVAAKPRAKLAAHCSVAGARQGIIVKTVVQFYMIEREPITCFIGHFRSSRPRGFAAPHWLQNAYGRSAAVGSVKADSFWM